MTVFVDYWTGKPIPKGTWRYRWAVTNYYLRKAWAWLQEQHRKNEARREAERSRNEASSR